MNIKKISWLGMLGLGVAAGCLAAPAEERPAEVMEVRKIWDRGEHNAFTDLIRWHGRWWCTFRESLTHVSGEGAIRVLESADGDTWTSAALVTEKDIDLRDPKFSITPQDRLMINCGGAAYLGAGRQSRVLFSDDGRTWTAPRRVLGEGEWLWRVTWLDGVAYGATYDKTPSPHGDPRTDEWPLALYSSRDGVAWVLIAPLAVTGQPNETTLRFLPNGDMVAMVRREGGDHNGTFGLAAPPYRNWSWHPSNYRFGGPNFLAASGGGWIATTRDSTHAAVGTKKGSKTIVARVDLGGALAPLAVLATLPSDGDCSYAGMAWHEGRLWLSYYSSHEGKSAIYLAKLKIP